MMMMMMMMMMKTMKRMICYLSSSELVATFQQICGLHPAGDTRSNLAREAGTSTRQLVQNGHKPDSSRCQYEVKNWLLYFLFMGSATLGNEVFYISFMPFIHWNLDPFLCRRLVNMWALVMYIGQAMKDVLKIPRPTSPPVVKLEHRLEFGMPSTHAMAATAIAFTLLLSAPERMKFQFELGLVAAVVLSGLVSLSRLYTGMHSALDVICGCLLSALILGLTYPHWGTLDFLQLNSPFSPIVALFLPLYLCYNYPELEEYSATRKDTTIILGSSAGCFIGYWINQRIGMTFEPPGPFPVTLPSITPVIFGLGAARFIVGLLMLFLTRQVMQWVSLRLLCRHYRVELSDVSARRRKEIEVPLKFSTYSAIGLVNTVVVCRVFMLMGLL